MLSTLRNGCNESRKWRDIRDKQRGVTRTAHQYYTTTETPAKRMSRFAAEQAEEEKRQQDLIRQSQLEYQKQLKEKQELAQLLNSIRNEKKH